jgi:pilus assembly protein Flp/PilA
MTNMLRFVKRLWKDDEGATAIEYGLLAALVAVAIIAALTVVSTELNDTFTAVSDELQGAQDSAAGGGGGAAPAP